MLTTIPAGVWNLPHLGRIAAGKRADIVVAKKKGISQRPESFSQLNPQDILLVMHRGEIKLFDASLYRQIKRQGSLPGVFSSIGLEGETKFVKGNLPALMQEIAHYHPGINFPVSSAI